MAPRNRAIPPVAVGACAALLAGAGALETSKVPAAVASESQEEVAATAAQVMDGAVGAEATPDPTPTPEPTPDPTPEPEVTPEPHPEPQQQPTATPEPEPKPEPDVRPADSPEPADRGAAADPEPARPQSPVSDVQDGSIGAGRNLGEGREGSLAGGGTQGRRGNTGAGAGNLSLPRSGSGRDGARRRDGRGRGSDRGGAAGRHGLLPGGYAISLPATIRTIGVRKGAIDGFDIPVFLLPIYRAASERYGIPWEILAAINSIETEYGRNLAVSSAGALGWMQFMPGTWATYGVDANRDGRRDPNDPVDAIFAAARYLRAAGAPADMGTALYAYNHAHWYVRGVIERARSISVMQGALAESLTTLADGRLPVSDRSPAYRRSQGGVLIAAPGGSRVLAVNDGRIVRRGRSRALGTFLRLRDAYGNVYTYSHLKARAERFGRGHRVRKGALVGRLPRGKETAHLLLRIRPAGLDAPRIDPKPIVDGWTALATLGLERAERPSGTDDASAPSVLGGRALARRVLADPAVTIYGCGRQDILAGRIDRRVLAVLDLLSSAGLAPTVSSLQCGHSIYTTSGNVSEHATGSAVDISAINGIPIAGHQGRGSVTEAALRRLVALQGDMRPHQIISLMRVEGTDNTFAMSDHDDHIHVGFSPDGRRGGGAWRPFAPLRRQQWTRLIARLDAAGRPVLRAADPHERRD